MRAFGSRVATGDLLTASCVLDACSGSVSLWLLDARPGSIYAAALCSVEDMWEAVTTLEEAARTARRVLGGAHPTTKAIEAALREARAAPFYRSLVFFCVSVVAAAYRDRVGYLALFVGFCACSTCDECYVFLCQRILHKPYVRSWLVSFGHKLFFSCV